MTEKLTDAADKAAELSNLIRECSGKLDEINHRRAEAREQEQAAAAQLEMLDASEIGVKDTLAKTLEELEAIAAKHRGMMHPHVIGGNTKDAAAAVVAFQETVSRVHRGTVVDQDVTAAAVADAGIAVELDGEDLDGGTGIIATVEEDDDEDEQDPPAQPIPRNRFGQ